MTAPFASARWRAHANAEGAARQRSDAPEAKDTGLGAHGSRYDGLIFIHTSPPILGGMGDSKTTRRDIIVLVEQWIGRRHPVSLKSALYHDLDIAGDHAREIIADIAKRFGTSFEGFKFSAYFPRNEEGLGGKLARALGVRRRLKRLTVGHLVAVIEHGAWFKPGSKRQTQQTQARPKPSLKRPSA